jgi:hypothetical protein
MVWTLTSPARDPRRQKLIEGVLADFARLAGEPAAPQDGGGSDPGGTESETRGEGGA